MFALFIMGLMASMASAEPEADAQFFYYPSYHTYSAPSYYYPTYHTYPTYPSYQYTAPSYYYPSYVYPSLPKVQVQKQGETVTVGRIEVRWGRIGLVGRIVKELRVRLRLR